MGLRIRRSIGNEDCSCTVLQYADILGSQAGGILWGHVTHMLYLSYPVWAQFNVWNMTALRVRSDMTRPRLGEGGQGECLVHAVATR